MLQMHLACYGASQRVYGFRALGRFLYDLALTRRWHVLLKTPLGAVKLSTRGYKFPRYTFIGRVGSIWVCEHLFFNWELTGKRGTRYWCVQAQTFKDLDDIRGSLS